MNPTNQRRLRELPHDTAKRLIEDMIELLDGKEWDADTLDAAANLLRDAGFAIEDPT